MTDRQLGTILRLTVMLVFLVVRMIVIFFHAERIAFYPSKLGGNQVTWCRRSIAEGIKRVGLNRVAVAQLRLWGF